MLHLKFLGRGSRPARAYSTTLLASAVSNGRLKFKRSFETNASPKQGVFVDFCAMRPFGDRLAGRLKVRTELPTAQQNPRVNPLSTPYAHAMRGGAMPTNLLDLLGPPGRCSGSWPTSPFLFSGIVVRRFEATMELGRPMMMSASLGGGGGGAGDGAGRAQ